MSKVGAKNTGAKRRFIDGKHGQLHLRVAGYESAKAAIICLHMMPKSGRSFSALLPELAKDRLVIAPDYYGYGESAAYTKALQPSVSHYADCIVEVVKHFQLQRVHLVGYHTGSMVAAELAYLYPALVEKIINISAPVLTEEEISDFHQYYAPIELDQDGTRFKVMWERILHYAGPGMTLELAAESMAENLRGGERYEDGHKAAFDYAPTYVRRLQEIQQEVWVINPGDDLFEHTRRVDQYLNNGSRTDFPSWGHGFLKLTPEEVAQQLLNFLDGGSVS